MIRFFLAFILLLYSSYGYAQHVIIGGYVHTLTTIQSSTVAALPACNANTNNVVRLVTNALSPTVGSTVAGGGAVTVLVHCNGTNWIVA